MKFAAHIHMDNAAFDGDAGAEVARILRTIADELEHGSPPPDVRLTDINGNAVGRATITGRRLG